MIKEIFLTLVVISICIYLIGDYRKYDDDPDWFCEVMGALIWVCTLGLPITAILWIWS